MVIVKRENIENDSYFIELLDRYISTYNITSGPYLKDTETHIGTLLNNLKKFGDFNDDIFVEILNIVKTFEVLNSSFDAVIEKVKSDFSENFPKHYDIDFFVFLLCLSRLLASGASIPSATGIIKQIGWDSYFYKVAQVVAF